MRRCLNICFKIVTIVTFLSSCVTSANAGTEGNYNGVRTYKTKLHDILVNNYGPTSSRPVKNESSPVNVKFRMLVDHLVDFDEPKQDITLFCSVKIIWTDEYLTWNESDYGGLTSLQVNVDEIWIPDITLLTSSSSDYLSLSSRRVSVSSSGEVTWLSPAIITSLCVLDVALFPFDTQNCTIGFGSFASPSTLVDLDFFFENNVTTVNRYQKNGVWEIIGDLAFKVLHTYSSSDDAFAEVYYHIIFSRLAKVYVLSILFPTLLLSLSTIFIFILPPESGEKISLGITNLLAMVVFQEVVFSAMPPSGSPVIANTMCIVVLISCLAILLETIAQRMYFYDDSKPVPEWLSRLLIKQSTNDDSSSRSGNGVPRSVSKVESALTYELSMSHSKYSNCLFSPSEGNGDPNSASSASDALSVEMRNGNDETVLGDHDAGNDEPDGRCLAPNGEREEHGEVSSSKVTSSDRLSDINTTKGSIIKRVKHLRSRDSLLSEQANLGNVNQVPRRRSLGNRDLWKRISLSFEKKSAFFLSLILFLSIIGTVLQLFSLYKFNV